MKNHQRCSSNDHGSMKKNNERGTWNYMYHLTYHRRNMSLYTLTLFFRLSLSLWLVWVHTYTLIPLCVHVELRPNWTLKGECQFHVKSLFLFLFAWVWDSSFSLLTEPRAHLHLLRWRVRQIQVEHVHTHIIHELNLKVKKNLSYVNAKSQEKEERYYTI